MKEVTVQETGTRDGYEHYHNEYYLDDELIGSSSWDKNQRNGNGLHVGSFTYGTDLRKKHPKNFYAETAEGIAYQMEKIIGD